MAKFHIETGQDNAILRTKSTTVSTHELRKYRGLADDMVKYIKNPKNGGIGLAAPQVGVNKRIIVVALMKTRDDEHYRIIPMVNPVILTHTNETALDNEGCLSVPGESGDVLRYAGVEVEFLDVDGTKRRLQLDHLAARIVQHEIDHLDGILFTDKIENRMLVM